MDFVRSADGRLELDPADRSEFLLVRIYEEEAGDGTHFYCPWEDVTQELRDLLSLLRAGIAIHGTTLECSFLSSVLETSQECDGIMRRIRERYYPGFQSCTREEAERLNCFKLDIKR